MDGSAFLARVGAYHEAGWRLALINATTVVAPAAGTHGHVTTAEAATTGAGAPTSAGEVPAPATPPAPSAPVAPPAVEAPGVFEIAWAFARGNEFETIREQIEAGEAVPSVSELFGAAFLYENEIRELFGINVTGIGLDLHGQLYKTATRVPFSHAAIKARLKANAAAVKKP
ncbi:MAG: NADH-quinone oxidoreductase subunit C [Candidatus Limnocylindrales bacterium]|jgi:hypothetical protein